MFKDPGRIRPHNLFYSVRLASLKVAVQFSQKMILPNFACSSLSSRSCFQDSNCCRLDWSQDDQTLWNMTVSATDLRWAGKLSAEMRGKSILLLTWPFVWSAAVGNDRLIRMRVRRICVCVGGRARTHATQILFSVTGGWWVLRVQRPSFAFWQRFGKQENIYQSIHAHEIQPPIFFWRPYWWTQLRAFHGTA